MCGITGIYKFNESEISEMTLVSMTESLKHRGPDSGSVWIGKKVGFGHRLLKIQDLSDNSVQPISYKEWVLTYNGEVYNFQELKNELKEKGYTFDTISDTEVVIKSFDCWGID